MFCFSSRQSTIWVWIACFVLFSVRASAGSDTAPDKEDAFLLAPVTIPEHQPEASGTTRLTEAFLEALPKANSTLTDSLRSVPGVQLGESADSGLTGGEILPPEIAISGGRFYENDFRLDSLGINSFLDPAEDTIMSPDKIPGHSMAVFPDPAILSSVTVHAFDVPVKFGGFTGGVVDAVTRNPGRKFSAWGSWRGSRDQWTSFHIPEEMKEDFSSAKDERYQPRFEKNTYRAGFESPVSENAGVLFSYTKTESSIPSAQLGRLKNQTRTMDQILAKYVWQPDSDTTLEITLDASPYTARYFHNLAKDSDFTFDGGGFRAGATLTMDLFPGTLQTTAGYLHHENIRKAPPLWRRWNHSPSANWGEAIGYSKSMDGGFGDLTRSQKTTEFRLDFTGRQQQQTHLSWSFDAGLALAEHQLGEARPETAYFYTGAKEVENFSCPAGAIDCIPQEQYLYRRLVYDPYDVAVESRNIAGYLATDLLFHRVSFHPGIRLDWDSDTTTTYLSPRLRMGWDLFGNGTTRLRSGAARYYGRRITYLRLREKRGPLYRGEQRGLVDGQLGPFTPAKGSDSKQYRYDNLKAPYTDEWTLGLDQHLFKGTLSLSYIERRNKDAITLGDSSIDSDGLRIYPYTNRGESRYKAAHLTWSRTWKYQDIAARISWEETLSATDTYDDKVSEHPEEYYVYYQGRFRKKTDLPRTNFSRPWTADLISVTRLPFRITFTNRTSFRASYKTRQRTGETYPLPAQIAGFDENGDPVTEEVSEYKDIKRKSYIRFDWRLAMELPRFWGVAPSLTMDILNVFNHEILTGTTAKPLAGRQLWLGVAARF